MAKQKQTHADATDVASQDTHTRHGHQEQEDHLAIRQSDLGTPITLKEGPLFLLTEQSGEIPPQTAPGHDRGLGLYFHDMRHLDEARLRLNGAEMTLLLASPDLGYQGIRELANPDLATGDDHTIRKETIGLHGETTLGEDMREQLTLHNFNLEALDLTLTLEYAAHFDDMFTVRGVPAGQRGTLHDPAMDDDRIAFRYDGADGHHRTTEITFDPAPARFENRCAVFLLHLQAGGSQSLHVTIAVADHPPAHNPHALETRPRQSHHDTPYSAAPVSDTTGLLGGDVRIATSNDLFNRVLRRSFLDLRMLAMRQGDDRFFAAGVPWYVALFGRDSLITALETLAYNPELARTTLDLLARYQGQRNDPERDEEPGKILHELRVGEMANLHEVPFTPYYGTIDATPLFLILLGEYLQWSGDLAYFAKLRPTVEAALTWLDRYGDNDGDGFLEYDAKAKKGLANQGWKDSGNSIVNADGSLVASPVALVEVQGYAYRARRAMANAFDQAGDESRAAELAQAANELRRRFQQQFWQPQADNYALALQGAVGEKCPAVVDASNQGQALWGGIVAPEHAAAVRDTLMDPAKLFAGWGIRTLSRGAVAYNPFDYQVGSIWPHDNALIAVGLRAYNFDDDALRIFTGLYEAATRFEYYRLPELFAGFGRADYRTPVRYPVACNPQAWAAGALPNLLQAVLGLVPDAFANRLHVIRPCLPDWLDWVTISGLRVGQGRVDLRYERSGDTTLTATVRKEGAIQVAIEY
ncbi:MAG: amylo-alpha-1,6-glucosidase [Thermomicrobiales bacterium]